LNARSLLLRVLACTKERGSLVALERERDG
jgi:hypothetical protein